MGWSGSSCAISTWSHSHWPRAPLSPSSAPPPHIDCRSTIAVSNLKVIDFGLAEEVLPADQSAGATQMGTDADGEATSPSTEIPSSPTSMGERDGKVANFSSCATPKQVLFDFCGSPGFFAPEILTEKKAG